MCSLLARAVPLTLVFLAACAPALGEDFDGYVERPTTCDLLNPRAADPHQHVPCGAGETCASATADGSYSSTARTCFPSKGSAHALEACEYTTDCAPGSTCDRVFGCLPYCRLSESACGDAGTCVAFSDAAPSNGGDALGYCAPPSCDPLGSDCDGSCRFHQLDHTGCFPKTGSSALGASCMVDTDCVGSLACGRQGLCTRYCRIDPGADDCEGAACEPVDGEDLSFRGVRYGYCERISLK